MPEATLQGLVLAVLAGDLVSSEVLRDALLDGPLAMASGQLVLARSTDRYHTAHEHHFAYVRPGKSIELFGIRYGKNPYAKRFVVGDEAVHGSYNLIYTGTIRSISTKRIVVEEDHGTTRTGKKSAKSLTLDGFDWRNWDFDAARIAKQNYETSLCI